jgi:hypothetical protein
VRTLYELVLRSFTQSLAQGVAYPAEEIIVTNKSLESMKFSKHDAWHSAC